MQGYLSLVGTTMVCAALSWPAAADPLGNLIAEYLCYPKSASHLALSSDQRRQLAAPATITGRYRDIQGSDARAWLTFENGVGRCRVPATARMDVFYCADVTVVETGVSRSRRYLCLD